MTTLCLENLSHMVLMQFQFSGSTHRHTHTRAHTHTSSCLFFTHKPSGSHWIGRSMRRSLLIHLACVNVKERPLSLLYHTFPPCSPAAEVLQILANFPECNRRRCGGVTCDVVALDLHGSWGWYSPALLPCVFFVRMVSKCKNSLSKKYARFLS